MVSRVLFGWSSPHVQPLTPVSETSEPPSPDPADGGPPPDNGDGEGLDDGADEDHEPPPAAVPFKCLFACSDPLDWALMADGGAAADAHGVALVVYLHLFCGTINSVHGGQLFDNIKQARCLSFVPIDLKAIPLHNIHVLFAKFSCDSCSEKFGFKCVRTFVLTASFVLILPDLVKLNRR